MSKRTLLGLGAWALATTAVVVAPGCSGGAAGTSGQTSTQPGSGELALVSVEVGRLVDILAYRIVDPAGSTDRRATQNRQPVVIAEDVVVNPTLMTDELFDVTGAARADANYRFLPFDVTVGHDQLLILWDDQSETDQFDSARALAETGLVSLSPAFRGQNVLTQPIPVAPRNGAFKLTFTSGLEVDSDFFRNTPSAVQVLRFDDDPDLVGPVQAFVPQEVRVIAQDNVVILDTTVLGNEAVAGLNPSDGLDASLDQITANYRIAIPVNGIVSDLFNVETDSIGVQNRIDFRGDSAVVRDFRSGNSMDGPLGALPDISPPNLISIRDMGILDVDVSERILTINRRDRPLALRGRVPFVDGPFDPDTGLPAGAQAVPTADSNGLPFPLPSGDFISQTVVSPGGELITLRAEVVENLDVNNVLGMGEPGLTGSATDGGELATARVRVTSVQAFDSMGNLVRFEAAPGAGAACQVQVRYYESVPYRSGAAVVSDSGRRSEFMTISPEPVDAMGVLIPSVQRLAGLTDVDPNAEIGVLFSEPVDLDRLVPTDNFVMTTETVDDATFQQAMGVAKSASLSVLNSELIDQQLDGADLRLRPPLGLDHAASGTETYYFHMDLSNQAVVDLAGNPLQLFDFRPPSPGNPGAGEPAVPLQNFSVPFDLSSNAPEQRIGSRVFRFAAADEDGTPNGAFDFFGQFQLADGVLSGAPVTRQSLTADGANLGAITRASRGECYFPGNAQDHPIPLNPVPLHGTPGIAGTASLYGAGADPGTIFPMGTAAPSGLLYETPDATFTIQNPPAVFTPPQMPQMYGGIVEPHTPFGARLQMTYREDDFGLSYRSANDMNIDVEQMYWASWNEQVIRFDVFDRYTLQLGHSRKRPDVKFEKFDPAPGVPPPPPTTCEINCLSLASGLSTTFNDNPLRGVLTPVVSGQEYVINPANAFRSVSGFVYHQYPTFQQTFTWRDSRLVSVDENGMVVGLGGAIDPASAPAADGGGDATASVDSPWIPSTPLLDFAAPMMPDPTFFYPQSGGFPVDAYVEDAGDFVGDVATDHDPIALPLLMDISVFPDTTVSQASGVNEFHMAFFGPGPVDQPVIGLNGYYNFGNPTGGRVSTTMPFLCTNLDWPSNRVYSFGGPDISSPGSFTRVIPDQALTATGGTVIDRGVGAFLDPTNGLGNVGPRDSHVPWAQIDLVRKVSLVTFGFFDTEMPNQHALDPMTVSAPLPPANGIPDLSGLAGVDDIVAVLDPPVSQQPGGTSITLEFRGADMIPNAGIYDPQTNDTFDTRSNLLSPNFACEAYRYAAGDIVVDDASGDEGPQTRPAAAGLTPYVIEGELDTLRDPVTGLLPRFFNTRLVLENNIDNDSAAVPFLRGFGISYRMN